MAEDVPEMLVLAWEYAMWGRGSWSALINLPVACSVEEVSARRSCESEGLDQDTWAGGRGTVGCCEDGCVGILLEALDSCVAAWMRSEALAMDSILAIRGICPAMGTGTLVVIVVVRVSVAVGEGLLPPPPIAAEASWQTLLR